MIVNEVAQERPKVQAVPAPRLSEVLFQAEQSGFRTFAVLPSNVDAVESALLFANELTKFVVLHGKSGWGKTHLLEAAAKHHRKLFQGSQIQVLSASEWVSGFWSRMQSTPLILDHVQDCITKTRQRLQLRLALERRVRAGWPTMLSLTGERLPTNFSQVVPNVREWQVAQVRKPEKVERQVIVASMAKREGLLISDSLRNILSDKLDVNGRSYEGALNRLKLIGNRWMTDGEVIQACGILNPYFADRPNWDLREEILTVSQSVMTPEEGCGQLALYVMLKVAGLNEDEVSHYLQIEPSAAYAGAKAFSGRLLVEATARKKLDLACRQIADILES